MNNIHVRQVLSIWKEISRHKNNRILGEVLDERGEVLDGIVFTGKNHLSL